MGSEHTAVESRARKKDAMTNYSELYKTSRGDGGSDDKSGLKT